MRSRIHFAVCRKPGDIVRFPIVPNVYAGGDIVKFFSNKT